MIKILMVASEAAPFAKSGGLGDVVGSLPGALRENECDVAVLLPRYKGVGLSSMRRVYDLLPVWIAGIFYQCSLYLAETSAPFYFLECPQLYGRDGYYGDAAGDYPDNAIRFAVLSRAALAVARRVFRPDIVHCHDWQTGLIPVYIRPVFAYDPPLIGIRTLFTTHNLLHQGLPLPPVLPPICLDRPVLHRAG